MNLPEGTKETADNRRDRRDGIGIRAGGTCFLMPWAKLAPVDYRWSLLTK